MIYRDFDGDRLSLLGFGTMRLPVKENGEINEELVAEMTDYAMSHGINYYDTAYPYMQSKSEIVIGKALKKYPRDSFYLATKFPGHMLVSSFDPKPIFEEQLKKCGVDYFDYYLLHNVYENDIDMYMNPELGIVDYFVEMKKQGKIRHLGFSSHGNPECIDRFLQKYGDVMEFCQLQFNYLDWTLQNVKEKYDVLAKYGIKVWVMEPVRGGKLANLPENLSAKLKSFRSDVSDASFGFRWLEQFENIRMILSGMSDMNQMTDNVATFEKEDFTSDEENAALMEIAESLKNGVPCTACRYCCDGCPMELNIPDLMSKYNQLKSGAGSTIKMQLDAQPKDKWPSACIGCGACAAVCPQKIRIPDIMRAFSEELDKLPDWHDICVAREEAARKVRESN